MLSIKIDEEKLIAILQPEGPLSEKDFQLATNQLAPFIKNSKRLNGLIIYTKFFPGWQSLPALFSHFRFVKNHHQKVSHLVLVSDSILTNFATLVIRHFIKPKIKVFPYHEFEKAKKWVVSTVVKNNSLPL